MNTTQRLKVYVSISQMFGEGSNEDLLLQTVIPETVAEIVRDELGKDFERLKAMSGPECLAWLKDRK